MTRRGLRKTVWALAGPFAAVAALGVTLRYQSDATPTSAAPAAATSPSLTTAVAAPPSVSPTVEARAIPGVVPTEPAEKLDETHRGGLDESDGVLPDRASVFDETLPGITRLDPALLSALRRAVHAAAADGVVFNVNSGWRSKAYQEQLLEQAIATYGSRQAAARWVASPDASPHVAGHAVDIGPATAATWLSRHGPPYGLCQIYKNEPWHYELRPDASTHGCPAMYADPTRDPRLQP
ncbi:MAG: hypothetical protein JWQ74_7 [Marmoricola sp.]|nr:hypothetical protein [Marmoricola sp.]